MQLSEPWESTLRQGSSGPVEEHDEQDGPDDDYHWLRQAEVGDDILGEVPEQANNDQPYQELKHKGDPKGIVLRLV